MTGPSPYNYSQIGASIEAQEEEESLSCDFFPEFGEEGFPSQGALGTIEDYTEGDFEVTVTVDDQGNPAAAIGDGTLINYTTLTGSVPPKYALNQSFTISLRTILPVDGNDSNRGYIFTGLATAGEGYDISRTGYGLARWEDRIVFVFLVEARFEFFLTSAVFDDSKFDGGWHDITFVYDGSFYEAGVDWTGAQSCAFYLDGEQLTTDDEFAGSTTTYPADPEQVISDWVPSIGYEPVAAASSGGLGVTLSQLCIREGRDLSQVRAAVRRVLSQ